MKAYHRTSHRQPWGSIPIPGGASRFQGFPLAWKKVGVLFLVVSPALGLSRKAYDDDIGQTIHAGVDVYPGTPGGKA